VLSATGAGCGGGNAHSGVGWLLGALAVVVMAGGWYGLYWVAAGYDRAPDRRRLVLAGVLGVIAFGCVGGAMLAWLQLRTDHCGRIVGSAGTWEGWLFVVAVLSTILSVRVRKPNTGWLSGAVVLVADLATVLLLLGLQPAFARTVAVALLLVHAGCTGTATWWWRQARSCPPALLGRVGEAGRLLTATWISLLIMLAAAGHQIGRLLPDSVLASLFVVTAVGLVFGPGYTRYLDTRHDPAWQPPKPDRLTAIGNWAVRYHEHW
jgi:hypothetical protein